MQFVWDILANANYILHVCSNEEFNLRSENGSCESSINQGTSVTCWNSKFLSVVSYNVSFTRSLWIGNQNPIDKGLNCKLHPVGCHWFSSDEITVPDFSRNQEFIREG